ncbi:MULTISPECIES: YbbR-like domain-containing protein [unclassified Exiguobacterium]|uniref:YbbR family protein n=1 Tax=Exiguobacterium sp. (strain ATCC BAA-1283 / AT1b) TaxID=360911 RepID=C4KZK5_EXISA|nr:MULTISPECIES: CdaR family protein [unclassified Exiguobacterium]ACQ70518.1 YbbR family protein [Exiguobacterium sp. AT1b]
MIDQWLQHKWFLRFIALALAVLLYLMVAETSSSNNASSALPIVGQSSMTLDVPVEVFFDEVQYVAYNVPEEMGVELQGPSSSLTMTKLVKDYQVFVDLTNLGTGFHRVPVEARGFGGDVNVKLDRETVEIYIDRKQTIEVPVSVNLLNKDQLPDGKVAGDVEIEPSTVKVTGGASRIQNVKEITLNVDVSNQSQTFTREIPPTILDANGNPLNVSVDPNIINVTVPIYNESAMIPIEVVTSGEVADDFRLVDTLLGETEVRVFAPKAVLDELQQVETEPIELDDLTKSEKVTATLRLPEGATSLGKKEVEVQVLVRPNDETKDDTGELTERIRLTVPINVRGYDRTNFTIQTQDVVSVTLSGKRSLLESISSNSVNVTLDLTGLPSGTHAVDADYEVPKGVTVISPKTIDVQLTGVDEETETSSIQ